jgi:hypothetical protein
MKSLVFSLMAGLALIFAVSTAEAGGGTKPNSTIKVTNNTGVQLGVIVDASTAIQTAIGSGTISQTTFLNAGGKIVDNGGAATFSVKAGAHIVYAAQIIGGTTTNPDLGAPATLPVTTVKGKTKTVIATADGTDTILTLQP